MRSSAVYGTPLSGAVIAPLLERRLLGLLPLVDHAPERLEDELRSLARHGRAAAVGGRTR